MIQLIAKESSQYLLLVFDKLKLQQCAQNLGNEK